MPDIHTLSRHFHAAPVTNIDNVSGVAFSSIANVAGVTATDGQAINGITF